MHWLVGDIQGCASEFEALLKAMHFRVGVDHLESLGDLVNRGPDNAATLRLWAEVGGSCVLGNHDLYAVGTFRGKVNPRPDTLDDLWRASDAERLLARLESMPVLRSVSYQACETALVIEKSSGVSSTSPRAQTAWLVHAGIHPAWGDDLEGTSQRLERRRCLDLHDDPEIAFATRVRCCDAEGNQLQSHAKPSLALAPYAPWDSFYRGSTPLFHGHWATRGFHQSGRVTGLDSGCVYGGRLTAWCLEEARSVSVAARRAYATIE